MRGQIRFGTDGWRDVIADRFTVANVARVAQAIAGWMAAEGHAPRGAVVGYDTRFLSRRFAETAAAVLATNDVPVHLCDRPAPTPAVSWAIRAREAGGGIMITASHNPAEYNGVKLKAHYAGSALPEMTADVERRFQAAQERGEEPPAADLEELRRRGRVEVFSPVEAYRAQLERYVDLDRAGRAGLRVVVDTMHGCGRGFLAPLLRDAGVDVCEVRAEARPDFGGTPPEPIARNLRPARAAVIAEAAHVGLCLDGDADRVAAVDAGGRVVDAHQVFALLLRHLHEDRGLDGSVVKTFAGSRMIARLARRYGLPYYETPIGFKHVCRRALQETVLVGGEESGGIGVRDHIPERDGILCNLLLVEMMAHRGQSPGALVADVMADVGAHHFLREDLRLSPEAGDRLMSRLSQRPPERLAGLPVEDVDPLDGMKLLLGEHGWLLLRASGTEPVVRIYAEADAPDKARRLLAAGVALAREA